ncbi:MAG TPA: plasmid pRiA4b ORF-3 family protein [Bryobacteraceae bacterium]|nr:plasmid pRiA4b ORF-3 family protein [Bryobacteraceae bacterium]
MPTKKNEGPEEIYQIKVTLLGTKPPIWRRLLVPGKFTLEQLHDVLQAAMGWQDCHLHEFRVGRDRFGVPDPNDRLMGLPACIHERKVRLSDVLLKPGAQGEYTYDFGDSWEHVLSVEKILLPEAGLSYPLCTDGKLHGPPEDCGGLPGFYNFLEAIQDPDHDEHGELLEWIGGSFDPESFSAGAVNQRLQFMFRRRKAKSKPAVRKTKRATAG